MAKLLNVFLLFIISIGITSYVNAQDDSTNSKSKIREYNSLLWKVTGNNLEKPTYIYASVADISNYSRATYHQGDTFYIAIENADYIVFDLNSDSTAKEYNSLEVQNILKTGPFKGLSDQGYSPSRDFYVDAFMIYPLDRDDLIRLLANSRSSVYGGMYSGFDEVNVEEPIESFVVKAAKKLDKQLLGVRTYKQDLNQRGAFLHDLAKEYEELLKKDESQEERKNKYELRQKSEDFIRRGDLRMIDSLYRTLNPGTVLRTFYYEPVTKQTVEFLDSLMPLGAVFSVVEAQTMIGDKGVIQLLEEKGYTVQPVKHFLQTKPSKKKEKIEEITKSIKFTSYTPDSKIYTVQLPEGMIAPYLKVHYSSLDEADPVNSSNYTADRILNYFPFISKDIEETMVTIDSLLFEYIPGEIIKKKRIEKAGFPGYDITHKTADGKLCRMLFMVTPLDILSFYISGPGKYIKKSKTGSRFIESIDPGINKAEGWNTITPLYGEYSVDMPVYASVDTGNFGFYRPENIIATGWNKASDAIYYFSRNIFHDYEVLEEDTFELNYMTEMFAENLDLKIANRNLGTFDNYASIDFSVYKENNIDTISGRMIIRGPYYYLLWTNASNKEQVSKFFNSLSFIPFKGYEEFKTINDTILHYSVESPCLKEESDFNEIYNFSSYGRDDEEEDISHEADVKYATYHYSETGEHIEVYYQKHHDYDGYENTDSLKLILEKYAGEKDFVITKRNFVKKDTLLIYDFEFTDTNSSRKILIKNIVNGGVRYRIKTLVDSLVPLSPFVSTFFNTFKPLNDTLPGRSLFEDKEAYFLTNLTSEDSTLRVQARSSYNLISFDSTHVNELVKFIDKPNYFWDDLSLRASFIKELGEIKSSALLPFFERKFSDYEDTMTLQIAVLTAVSAIQTEEAYSILLKLMKKDLPLTDNSEQISPVFAYLIDTLELAKPLYPALFEYTRYEEYEDHIYRILSLMIDSGLVSINDFPEEKELLIRSILEDFEREDENDLDIAYEVPYNEEVIEEVVSGYFSSNSFGEGNYSIVRDLISVYELYESDNKVKELFEKAFKSNSESMKSELVLFMIRKDLSFNDTLIPHLCKKPETRADFYERLFELGKKDLFDTTWLNQKDISYSLLFSDRFDNEEDTVIFLEKRLIDNKFKTGWVYFFKIKEEDDEEWTLAYCGIQPEDTTKVSVNVTVSSTNAETIYSDDDIEELIDDEMKRFRVYGRKRLWNEGYDFDYNMYDYYY